MYAYLFSNASPKSLIKYHLCRKRRARFPNDADDLPNFKLASEVLLRFPDLPAPNMC